MKGLGPRAYNILFHTHTVSGITISAVLFVLFFAGAIALFKQEIYQWEAPAARISVKNNIDYERMIYRLDSIRTGIHKADEIRVVLPVTARPVYTVYAPVNGASGMEYATFIYNPQSDQITELFRGDGTTTGDTLYRLHFLDQVPWYIGRYIAGFVSLFFAFAVISGLLIHWKNIVSKFYAFSFKQVRKQFWTNAHTVFGVIGLPFQLMYAITGAFYLLSVFILAPAVITLFKGDQQKLITKIYPAEAFHQHGEHMQTGHWPVAQGVAKIRKDHPGYRISYLEIINPGKENAALGCDLIDDKAFNRNGTIVLDLHTGRYKLQLRPGTKNYAQSLLEGISKVHFATFGGILLKILYFLLAMISCFVIISGVLMWKEARNKASYTWRQRRFHHRVTIVYLSVCFSLFPATALLFIAEHLVPLTTGHARMVNMLFFSGWLLFALTLCFFKKEKHITAFCLLTGGILALAVPLANGLSTGDWLWHTAGSYPYVFYTDIVWLFTGILSLLLFSRLKKISDIPKPIESV